MKADKKRPCIVKAGIVYFPTYFVADSMLPMIRIEFPECRIVRYDLGYAIQTRKSGDYIGPNLRPSMENAMLAFDKA